jgi:hypothetical protein
VVVFQVVHLLILLDAVKATKHVVILQLMEQKLIPIVAPQAQNVAMVEE